MHLLYLLSMQQSVSGVAEVQAVVTVCLQVQARLVHAGCQVHSQCSQLVASGTLHVAGGLV